MKEEQKVRVNRDIRARRVVLIASDGRRLGEFLTSDAINLASEEGMDLVEVGGGDDIPTCKIMDYGKHLYELKKRHKKSKSATISVKEVRFKPTTDENDLNILVKRAEKFLEKGDKVKVVVKFRGREGRHLDLVRKKCLDFCSRLSDIGDVESPPALSGPQMSAVLAPKRE